MRIVFISKEYGKYVNLPTKAAKTGKKPVFIPPF